MTDANAAARPKWVPVWGIVAGFALVAGSQWLHAPGVEYLVVWLVATVVAIIAAIRLRGAERWWAWGSALGLAGAIGIAAPAQQTLLAVGRDWDVWRHATVTHGLASLKMALDDALTSSDGAARVALHPPPTRSAAFAALAPLSNWSDERGVVAYHGDSALAWSGTIRTGIDPSREGITVVGTPFYLAIQQMRRDGDSRSLVVSLLDAAPPANKLSAPLARRIAIRNGLSGFLFAPPGPRSTNTEILQYSHGGQRLFDVRANPLVQGEVFQRITERARARAGLAFVVALMCFIIGVWRATRSLGPRVGALLLALGCVPLIPLSQYSNITRLFDPAVYFTAKGGAFTGNAGALAMTSAIVVLGVLGVFRRQARRVSRLGAVITILLVAGLGPFLLRELARGVVIPAHGVDGSLWLIWEIPLFLAAVSVLLAGAAAGAAAMSPYRGLSPWVAPAAAAASALVAPIVWEAPGRWPWWYTLMWVAAIGMLAVSRRTRFVILSASAVAAFGATTLVWARTARGRVDAAERDLAGLSETDSVSVELLRRFGAGLALDIAPTTRQGLLKHYVTSDIAAAGNPVALSAWPTDSGPVARFETASIPMSLADEALIVAAARQSHATIIEAVPTDTAVEVVMAAPSLSGGVTVVALAPKSRLFETDPFARLLGLDVDADAEPPYTLRLRERLPSDTVRGAVIWRREGSQLHGDWVGAIGTGLAAAHIEVELRAPDALVERGALIVLLDLCIVGLLWLASVIADGGAGRWIRARRRRWGRSYRAQLSLALFGFFVMPATAFAVWSYGQLATDATHSRELLVSETLRALAPPVDALWLPRESDRLDTPLFLYQRGELVEASDPLYAELAPLGRYLAPEVELHLGVQGEETTTRVNHVDGSSTLFGYRSFETNGTGATVLAAPARADEIALARRRRDLGVLVLFSTAVGALAALWLSGIAARQLARPIGSLRAAAMSIASGARDVPLTGEPTVEFSPVFTAFRRMSADLNASRGALEEAQRRTAAVLRNVASGVVAVDVDGRVTLANPRAEALLGTPLEPGVLLALHAPQQIGSLVERFLTSSVDEETFEVALDQQQIRGTLTRLGQGTAASLAVVTLDDVTELARAQRVLAWGEMARQVAHEIKNPLTPIRLGVQHLRRARADSRVDFDRVLDHNVNQILAEIDRLDEIARSFSRYGAAPDERPRPTAVDVAAVVRETVSLERMGEDTAVMWTSEGAEEPVHAFARNDELKEVLLNVLENARLAAARNVSVLVRSNGSAPTGRVTIAVRDDGHGIPPDVLPRIFEPHFSTRTSGSGLGLAISRQLVDGWGGEVSVDSAQGQGTTVTIALRAASGDHEAPPSE